MGNSIRLLCLCFALSSTGCIRGLLYTNTVEPYCTNMEQTPIGDLEGSSELRSVAIPRIPGARTVWSSNAIADAAKLEGLQTVEYCDRKKFSVLGGIFGNESIVVYGN